MYKPTLVRHRSVPEDIPRCTASVMMMSHAQSARVAVAHGPTGRPLIGSSSVKRSVSRAPARARAEGDEQVAAPALGKTSKKRFEPMALAMSASTALSTAALVALPALAEEAAGGEISPFAGVVDITVLGVVGLLAVQGNKKAEAAKAQKGGKKKR